MSQPSESTKPKRKPKQKRAKKQKPQDGVAKLEVPKASGKKRIVKRDYTRFMEEDPKDTTLEVKPFGKRKTGEGVLTSHFQDLDYGVGDVVVPQSSWDLSLYDFNEIFSSHPTCHLWTCDIGKLVVPDVSVEADLILELAKCYDPNDRVIKIFPNGAPMLDITRSQIVEVFNLNPSAIESIKFCVLFQEYEQNKFGYRKNVLPRYRRHDLNKKGVPFVPKDFETFDCDGKRTNYLL